MAKQPTPKVVTKKHLARMERERLQQRYLFIGLAVILTLVLVIVLFGVLDQQVLQKNKPVAKVGSTAISTGDFQTQVRFTRTQMINQLTYFMNDSLYSQFFGQYIQQLQGQLQAGNESQVGEQVLDQMIENQIILQEAQKMGITVSDAEIDKAIQEKFGYFPNGTSTPTITPTTAITATLNPTQLALVPPTATPTETPEVTATSEVAPTVEGATPAATDADTTATPAEAATATPASDATATPAVSPTPENTATPFPTATAYTEEGFKKAYDEYFTGIKDTGYTSQAFRENVRAELLREKVLQEVTKDVQPVQEQVWARHILVTTEEEAKVVEERLKAGEDFATLAKEVSTDTSNKEQGGDLGWFTKDRMVEPFSEAAFKLAVGEISPPVQSTFGWHVIQGLGHEDRPLTADQFEQAKQTAFQTWMDAKKTELNVEKLERWSQVVPVDPALPQQLAQPVQSQPIPNIPQ